MSSDEQELGNVIAETVTGVRKLHAQLGKRSEDAPDPLFFTIEMCTALREIVKLGKDEEFDPAWFVDALFRGLGFYQDQCITLHEEDTAANKGKG